MAPSERRWWTLAALVAPALVVVLDGAALPVALAPARAGLGAGDDQVVAIAVTALLVLAAVLPAGARLGARLGRRNVVVLGLAVLAGGSAAAAWAASAAQLVAGRALVGLGAALVLPAVTVVVREDFEPGERGRAVATWGGATGTAAVVGPVAVGALLGHAWWGAAFAVELPLLAVAVAVVLAWVPAGHAAFPLVSRARRRPRATRARAAAPGALVAGAGSAVLAGSTVCLALHLPATRGASPLQVALDLLPAALGLAAAGPRSAGLVTRLGTNGVCAGGLLLAALSCAGLLLVSSATPVVAVPALLLVLSVGVAYAVAPALLRADVPAARSVGAVLGVLVLGRLGASGSTAALHAAAVAGVLMALTGAAAASRLPGRRQVLSA